MPSGKRARQQRQQAVAAPPPVRSTGGAGLGARQASPRTLAIAGGIILLVIVAVVLAIVLSQGKGSNNGGGDGTSLTLATGTPTIGSSSTATNPNAAYKASYVATLLKGIPQSQFVLGRPDAPVTLVEWIDLQCPVCDQFEIQEFPKLVTKYVRPGKLKIELKPWNILDANDGTVDSLRGQKATIAAADQNKAFDFAEVLYWNQKQEGTNWMTDATISNFAASIDGLDTHKFLTDANSSATSHLISSVDSAGQTLSNQVSASGRQPGTPTLLLAKGTGKPKLFGVGYPDLSSLEAAINALLK